MSVAIPLNAPETPDRLDEFRSAARRQEIAHVEAKLAIKTAQKQALDADIAMLHSLKSYLFECLQADVDPDINFQNMDMMWGSKTD